MFPEVTQFLTCPQDENPSVNPYKYACPNHLLSIRDLAKAIKRKSCEWVGNLPGFLIALLSWDPIQELSQNAFMEKTSDVNKDFSNSEL